MLKVALHFLLFFFFSISLSAQTADSLSGHQNANDSSAGMARETYESILAESEKAQQNMSPFFKPDPKVHGNLTMQAFTTNVQSPLRMNAPSYLRLQGNSTVTMFSLPFNLQGYYTTERNNLYNPNYLRWSFDANQFQRNLELQAMEQAKKAREQYEGRVKMQGALEQQQSELQQYVTEWEHKAKARQDSVQMLDDAWLNRKEKGQYGLTDSMAMWKSKAKQLAHDSAIEAMRFSDPDRFRKYSDSLGDLQSKWRDSSTLWEKDSISVGYQKKRDSLLAEQQELEGQINKSKEQIAKLDTTLQLVRELRKRDSAFYQHISQKAVSDKGALVNKKLAPLMNLRRLDFGLINPSGSPMVMEGLSAKGINIVYEGSIGFVELAAGKTNRLDARSFIREKPVFDRNLMYAKLGYGDVSKSHFYGSVLHISDAAERKPLPFKPNQFNTVYAVGTKVLPFQGFTFEGEFAISEMIENRNYGNTEIWQDTMRYVMRASRLRYGAWYARMSQTLWKNGSLSYTMRHVDPDYRSLGKPFMRNDLQEHEIKYHQGMLKNRIRMEGFYKMNRDNLRNEQKVTNQMKGMGFKLSTHFKNRPNLTFSHTPYQMGNNHPDSLLNTKTQFATTTAMLYYPYTFKKGYVFSMASYTRTSMDWGNGRLVGMSVFTLAESLSWRQQWMV